MGTWNATPWGNDTAMDWLSELASHGDGRAFLASTLTRTETSENPDAPEAEESIAAAAVLAAAASDPIGTIPADAKQWIVTSGFTPDPELLDCALRVIASVRNQSELRDLWDESGKLKTWLKEVDKLAQRIEAARDTGTPARPPKAAGIPRSLHKIVALFASQPETKLREKIRARVAALKDPNAQTADTDFQTPLTLMARCGLREETLLLLARGADPDRASGRAFVEACVAGHLDVAGALYAAGVTLFHEHRLSPELGIAVPVAVKDPHEPVQGHRYCPALFAVARTGSPVAAEYLRELGASVDQTDINGETLLHKAAESGGVPMIHYLLDHGLDPDRTKGKSGESPLHYAARAGQLEAVRALLECGANPNAISRFEGEVHQWTETPLDIAQSSEVRELLIAHGGCAADDMESNAVG